MNEEQGFIRDILLFEVRQFDRWHRTEEGPWGRLAESLLAQYRPFAELELEAHLRAEAVHFSENPGFVFLPPIREHTFIIPILGLAYDFGRKIPEARFQVGLFTIADNKLVAVGLRFETPEGPGSHNYYHAQLIRSFFQHAEIPCSAWLPTSFPALALNAVNAGGLMVCMLVTLYGRTHLQSLPVLGGLLQRYTNLMHWIDPNPGKQSRFQEETRGGRWRWPA
jgi:hypothetical protein